MAQLSVGLIETAGLAAAIEAADAAVKSANVSLTGYELTKGGGMVLVKIEGDVAAVHAAISSAAVAAAKIGKVVSCSVIPRPAKGLSIMLKNADTVGCCATADGEGPEATPPEPPTPDPVGEAAAGESPSEKAPVEAPVEEVPAEEAPTEAAPESIQAAAPTPEPTPEPAAEAIPEPAPEAALETPPEPPKKKDE